MMYMRLYICTLCASVVKHDLMLRSDLPLEAWEMGKGAQAMRQLITTGAKRGTAGHWIIGISFLGKKSTGNHGFYMFLHGFNHEV